MRRTFAILFVTLSLLPACTRKKPSAPVDEAPEGPKAVAPIEKASAAATKPRNAHLQQIIKVATQADQIVREAWWVVANERPGVARSPFGKLQRAATQSLVGTLPSKGLFDCDTYQMTKEQLAKWTATFAESCGRNGAKEIARWSFAGEDPDAAGKAEVTFFPANLREVLGIGASLFSARLTCEVEWGDKGIIESLSCPHWQQDRGNQLARLDTFEYHREAGSMMKLRGQILENLNPVRKIEANVPLEGKITVVETELNPPVVTPEPAKPASKTSSVRGAGTPNGGVVATPDGATPSAPNATQPGGVAGQPPVATAPQRQANTKLPIPNIGSGPVPIAPSTEDGAPGPVPAVDPNTGMPAGAVVMPNGDVWIPNAPLPVPTDNPVEFAPAPVQTPAPTTAPSPHLAEPDFIPSGETRPADPSAPPAPAANPANGR